MAKKEWIFFDATMVGSIMRATPAQFFLMNLKRAIKPDTLYYMKKVDAYKGLKEVTGVDFGYDIEAWEEWTMDRSHFKTSPWAQIRRWGKASNPQNTICIPAVGHLAPP